MKNLEITLNAIISIIICVVLLSAYGVEFFWREVPCPLCMLQRLCMIGAALGCVLNVYFGVHPSHYGLTLLSCLAGGTVALRQISLHICPGFPQFGFPVLGLSLYTWSFVVFACTILSVSGLLFLYKPQKNDDASFLPTKIGKFAFTLLFLVAAANVFTTFLHCNFGPCHD